MTEEELTRWISESRLVDSGGRYDENGNFDQWRVYERGGKLYRLGFLNGHPHEKWGGSGFIRGVYEPREVIHETELVEVVRYRESG